MKKDIKLIAFDLDDTILNSDKTLSEENQQALQEAAAAGIRIVPATGRIFCGLPECIRALPLGYAIFANGAEVRELATNKLLYSAYLSNARAIELMHYLDTQPVAYDCYLDGRGYMAGKFFDVLEKYIVTPVYYKMVKGMRTPVPYLPDYVAERGLPLQKTQAFTPDPVFKDKLKAMLEERFPDLAITSSTPENLEINTKMATKGEALKALCAHLGFSADAAMAFGDGLNDISMIQAAGMGVAMANACPEALAAADYVTLTNNEAGVAAAIRKFCL